MGQDQFFCIQGQLAGLRAQTLHRAEVVEVGKTAGMYLARLLKAAV